jgi:hypothetical protein
LDILRTRQCVDMANSDVGYSVGECDRSRLHRRKKRKTILAVESIPEFYAYNKDQFFNAVWRWSYAGNGLPTDASSFCPNCDMQLMYHEDHGAYRAAGLTNTILFCDRCNERVTDVEGDYDHLERRVLREIERKVRANEYKRNLQPSN